MKERSIVIFMFYVCCGLAMAGPSIGVNSGAFSLSRAGIDRAPFLSATIAFEAGSLRLDASGGAVLQRFSSYDDLGFGTAALDRSAPFAAFGVGLPIRIGDLFSAVIGLRAIGAAPVNSEGAMGSVAFSLPFTFAIEARFGDWSLRAFAEPSLVSFTDGAFFTIADSTTSFMAGAGIAYYF